MGVLRGSGGAAFAPAPCVSRDPGLRSRPHSSHRWPRSSTTARAPRPSASCAGECDAGVMNPTLLGRSAARRASTSPSQRQRAPARARVGDRQARAAGPQNRPRASRGGGANHRIMLAEAPDASTPIVTQNAWVAARPGTPTFQCPARTPSGVSGSIITLNAVRTRIDRSAMRETDSWWSRSPRSPRGSSRACPTLAPTHR